LATILLVIADQGGRDLLERALRSAKFTVLLPSKEASQQDVDAPLVSPEEMVDVVITDAAGLALPALHRFVRANPQVPLVFFGKEIDRETLLKAMRLGVTEVVTVPVRYDELMRVLRNELARGEVLRQWAVLEARRSTQSLRSRIDELKTLLHVGRKLTAELDLDGVLEAVVDAALDFTGAEESTLFLLDEKTGDLYLRASRDFQSGSANTLRLRVEDTLAGQVVRTGKPVVLDQDAPEKIKTAYLVQALIYVPLYIHGRVIGVLGVDNRNRRGDFSERHVERLKALAEYAAVALDNAHLFAEAQAERSKLTTVLRHVKEGILVLDADGEIILVNRVAQNIMEMPDNVVGHSYTDFCHNPEVLEGIKQAVEGEEYRTEITAPDGRVFSLQAMPIPNVGVAITFYDIMHFKELDRLKSEFVNAVSHDLRSPLTAILGYVELLERAGPLTQMQQHFVKRVRGGVENITALINDLLDLGRIEAGFDVEKEAVAIANIVRYAVEEQQSAATKRRQDLVLHIAGDVPPVLGSAVRLRQMLDNIVGNAVKYTPDGGRVEVAVESRGQQVIIRVTDNGPGIPPGEQPYIFNKFFRGSNVAAEKPGTGLGLAIVKSIVENHRGRVWVESEVGKGTTFTVVLPGMEEGIVSIPSKARG